MSGTVAQITNTVRGKDLDPVGTQCRELTWRAGVSYSRTRAFVQFARQ